MICATIIRLPLVWIAGVLAENSRYKVFVFVFGNKVEAKNLPVEVDLRRAVLGAGIPIF